MQAYYILDEVLIAGELQETSKKSVARVIAAQVCFPSLLFFTTDELFISSREILAFTFGTASSSLYSRCS